MRGRIAAYLLVICLAASGCSASMPPAESNVAFDSPVEDRPSDEPSGFVFSYRDDMQFPELPTGCEATAVSTLLKMHSHDVSKVDVANAMPKSQWDFVDHFLGDPFDETGRACMAPCAAATANAFTRSGVAAVATKGIPLEGLGADGLLPACVWVTSYMSEPVALRSIGGYTLFRGTHCVVLYRIEDGVAYCLDPLSGIVEYPLELFSKRYEQLGSQAVYITEGAL